MAMFRVLKNIFRKKKTAQAENTEFTGYKATEVGFSLLRDDDGEVAFCLGNEAQTLFRVRDLVLSQPEVSQRERAGASASVYKFSTDFLVTCIKSVADIDFTQPLKIEKTECIKGYGGRQGLDIQVRFGSESVRYLVELDEDCPVLDFTETCSHEPKNIKIPPVAQMVDFLTTVIKPNRTVFSCLLGLVRHSQNEHVLETVNFIRDNFADCQELLDCDIATLSESLHNKGLLINANILAATCTLVDIFAEKLSKNELKASLDKKHTVKISPLSYRTVEAFFTENEATEQDKELEKVCNFLDITMKQRTFRSTVCDIAEDGGSEETAAVLHRLLELVPEKEDPAFEQCALCSLFEAYGKKVTPGTLSAFCLYTDLKAKIIDEDLIEQFLPETYLSEHSLYSMLVVGRAFGLNLVGLTLTGEKCEDALHDFSKLLALSNKGALASFLDTQSGSAKILYVKDSKELQKLCTEKYSFSGCIIIGLPILEKVSTLDMSAFLQKGLPLLSCFIDEQKRLRWTVFSARQVGEVPFSLVGRYGFVEGYEAYRFHNRVVGRIVKSSADKLVGKTNIAAAYTDEKGAISYRFIAKADNVESFVAPSDSGLSFAGEIAEFPRFRGFLGRVYESSQKLLAGLVQDENAFEPSLEACFKGSQAALSEDASLVSVAQDKEALAILRRLLRSEEFVASLEGAVERFACWRLSILLGSEKNQLHGNLQLAPKLIEALKMPILSQVAVMMVIYGILNKPGTILNSQQILWNPAQLRRKMQDSLFALLGNCSEAEGQVACRLLAATPLISVKDSCESSANKLRSLLKNQQLARAASEALAWLSLSLGVHFPAEVVCEGWERADIVDLMEAEAAEEAAERVRRWLDDPNKDSREKTLEAPALANIRGEEPKIKLLSRYMIKVDGAFQRENATQSRPYLILPPNFANVQRQKLVAAWHNFLAARNMSLSNREYGMNLFDSFCNYLPGYENTSNNEVAVRELDIFQLPGGRRLEPGSDPFFIKLASLIPPSLRTDEFEASSLPVICRCPYGTKDGEAIDLGTCEVFNVDNGEWVSFVDFRFCMALHLSADNRVLYETLGYIYSKVLKAKQADCGFELETKRPEGLISADNKEIIPPEQKRKVCLTLENLATNLAETFALNKEQSAKVVTILLGLRKNSYYKLPSYLENR